MSTPVEKIKQRLGIEEVVSSYIKLERAGKNLKAKCPFHNEKTPSFYVSPERNSFYCFGCGAKGDIFSFVEQFEGLDFLGALKLLADRAGVELVFERTETKGEKERLYTILEDAAKFFEEGLKHSPEARTYLTKRGITPTTIQNFRIGYVPNDWRLLYNYLKTKKYSDVEIEKAGLIKRAEQKEKGFYDRFRGRVMFPITDSSGRVIAFSGRILVDDGKSAKYLNSPDTVLFNKSTVLYGIDKAKQDIRTKGYTILVEGQMDLVLSHQAGIRNTVAVSGTALSDSLTDRENVVNNLGIVRRLSPNVILAFDSDAAGRKAAMRSAGIALSVGMDVKIADLPEGKDPSDLVLNNPDEWKNVLRKAKPVIEFQIDTVMRDVESKKLDPRKIPPLLREKVLPFIISLHGAMEKAHFIKMAHQKTGINEDAIREDVRKLEMEAVQKPTRQTSEENGILSHNVQVSRLDVISRKLFGLLAYLEREKSPIGVESAYRAMEGLLGSERYHNLIQELEPFKDELLLEAEILFGTQKAEAQKRHLEEFLLNFEEDIIRRDLTTTMSKLGEAERGRADTEAQELMKKCQVLAHRISEISKKRAV